jgi:hypothetical protein
MNKDSWEAEKEGRVDPDTRLQDCAQKRQCYVLQVPQERAPRTAISYHKACWETLPGSAAC